MALKIFLLREGTRHSSRTESLPDLRIAFLDRFRCSILREDLALGDLIFHLSELPFAKVLHPLFSLASHFAQSPCICMSQRRSTRPGSRSIFCVGATKPRKTSR